MVASLMINTQKLPKEVEATMKPRKQNLPFSSTEGGVFDFEVDR